jgi:PIN domain nuclease of toxin-antitoxin system
MKSVAADTHAVLWFLENDSRLTKAAVAALDGAQRILLPSMCLVEITYLVEKGRLHAAVLPRLLNELDNPATTLALAPLDLGVVLSLQDISRLDVPDMPDRVIAATALHHRVPLVTCDAKIRSCGVDTIW